MTRIWYLPACNELSELRDIWNGGMGAAEKNGMCSTFNGWLTSVGGTAYALGTTWSSTEDKDSVNHGYGWMNLAGSVPATMWAIFGDVKTDESTCRAVMAF